MKRCILLLMAVALLLGLCACGILKPDTQLKEEAQAQDSNRDEADAYVTVEESKTEYGIIRIPQIDEKMSDSEDVRLANQKFCNIRDRVLRKVEECKKELGEQAQLDEDKLLCVTRYAKNDSVLSVIVEFTEPDPYASEMKNYESVNIDVSTGKAMNHHELIKTADFTEDEVRASLRFYMNRSMFHEWEQYAFYKCLEEKTLPEGWGDPSYEWQEQISDLVSDYDSPPQQSGEPWDALPCYPTVYIGEAGLEVCIQAPTAAGAGYCNTMVRIGHDDAETGRLNPDTPFGVPFGRGAMAVDDAYEAVTLGIGFEDMQANAAGARYGLSAEQIESVGREEQSELAYAFKLYTDEGDHVATVDRYAVGVFSGTLWKMNISSAEWEPIKHATDLLPEEIYTDENRSGVLAVLWNAPSQFGRWVANPCEEVDLNSYDSNSGEYTPGGEAMLLFARQDDTVVSFMGGVMEGDGFAPQVRLWSQTLNAGESVSILFDRPKVPTQAITVSTPDDSGTYIIQYADSSNKAAVECITSDSAAG